MLSKKHAAMIPDMNPNERLLKFLQAPPDVQAQIDRILLGKIEPKLENVNGPLLIGMSDAAKFLGVSRATLWRMIRVGRIKPVEILPGSSRVRRADLESFVKSSEEKDRD